MVFIESFSSFLSWHVLIVDRLIYAFESFIICSRHIALTHQFVNLRLSCFFQLFFWRACLSSTTCSSLHVCIRGCLSCFWALRFFCGLALLNNEYLEHTHQFVSVNMACQVVSFGSLCQVWLHFFKILLVCAARDTHFSAFINMCVKDSCTCMLAKLDDYTCIVSFLRVL